METIEEKQDRLIKEEIAHLFIIGEHWYSDAEGVFEKALFRVIEKNGGGHGKGWMKEQYRLLKDKGHIDDWIKGYVDLIETRKKELEK